MDLLVGDIGGTKTRLAIVNVTEAGFSIVTEKQFASAAFDSLEALIAVFLEHQEPTEYIACFGLAGPVREQRCKITNLPWMIDAAALKSALPFKQAYLINDLEATAWGIDLLTENDLDLLHAGTPEQHGNISIIAAGTGLGQAGMFWSGRSYCPFPSEGSHSDFGPSTELDVELFRFLHQRYEHVSWERVVSGDGLANIFDFLIMHLNASVPQQLTTAFEQGDKSAAISQAAMNGQDPVCRQALDMFIRLYGAEAGNHALKLNATGGVYLGGGITPKVMDEKNRQLFLKSFFAKGRMQGLMERMPIRIILNDRAALFGPISYLNINGLLGLNSSVKQVIN